MQILSILCACWAGFGLGMPGWLCYTDYKEPNHQEAEILPLNITVELAGNKTEISIIPCQQCGSLYCSLQRSARKGIPDNECINFMYNNTLLEPGNFHIVPYDGTVTLVVGGHQPLETEKLKIFCCNPEQCWAGSNVVFIENIVLSIQDRPDRFSLEPIPANYCSLALYAIRLLARLGWSKPNTRLEFFDKNGTVLTCVNFRRLLKSGDTISMQISEYPDTIGSIVNQEPREYTLGVYKF